MPLGHYAAVLFIARGPTKLELTSNSENLVASAKETMVDIIARQPDDSSYDAILRELAYARMIDRGLADSDAGRTLPDEEVQRKIQSWSK